jgi:hypothetical protein
MQLRLASRLGFRFTNNPSDAYSEQRITVGRKLRRLTFAGLRYGPYVDAPYGELEARMRSLFHGLTPEDIRRYIGVRGESYLYHRQSVPRWEPVFAVIATVMRGLKRIEMLASIYN